MKKQIKIILFLGVLSIIPIYTAANVSFASTGETNNNTSAEVVAEEKTSTALAIEEESKKGLAEGWFDEWATHWFDETSYPDDTFMILYDGGGYLGSPADSKEDTVVTDTEGNVVKAYNPTTDKDAISIKEVREILNKFKNN